MTFIIYQISNDVNDLLYIGITNGTLQDRMGGHRTSAKNGVPKPLYIAMRSMGVEHFRIECLETLECERHVAESRESEYIRTLGTAYPHGYNVRAPLPYEHVAIIRFNPCSLSRAQLAQAFNVNVGLVALIRAQTAMRDGGKVWLVYPHVEKEYLPLQYQSLVLAKPPRRTKEEIWLTGKEAADLMSKQAGGTILQEYVRLLARQEKIASKKTDGRTRLYLRSSVEAYHVKKHAVKE